MPVPVLVPGGVGVLLARVHSRAGVVVVMVRV